MICCESECCGKGIGHSHKVGKTPFYSTIDNIRNPDPSVVNLYTDYEVSDRSFGLISRLGYHQYLADYLAQEIIQALKKLYNIQNPTGGNLRVSEQQF